MDQLLRARRIAANAAGAVGVELLAAVQGLDFHRPMKSSPSLELARSAVRASVAFVGSDRYLSPDLEWAKAAVLDGGLSMGIEAGLIVG